MPRSVRRLSLLLTTALVASVGLVAPAAAQTDPQPRVIHGRTPAAGEFGALVALATKSDGLSGGQFCGGSLVTSTLVVTAAHCLVSKGVVTAASTLIVGSTVALDSPDAKVADVTRVTVNPGYDEATVSNDVAVLTLASPLTGVPTVAVGTPAESSVRLAGGAAVSSAGWGNTVTTGESYPNSFLVADLTAFPTASCGGGAPYTIRGVTFDGLGPQDADAATMVCAAGVNAAGQVVDTCQGDSGGPLIGGTGAAARLVGVVSFGQTCASTTPGVYTRLSAFLDWLSGLGVPIGGGTTPPPGTPGVVITSPAPASPISSGGLFGVSATTTGIAAGTPAFLTLDGSAKAKTTVQADGRVRFDATAAGGGSWIPAEAGAYAVRICGSTCGPTQATSQSVSLTIIPFQIVGDPVTTASGLRFTVATGNWAPGTRIYVTRDGFSAGSDRVVRTGQRIAIATQDLAGTYQVRVNSNQGYVYGNQEGVVTLS